VYRVVLKERARLVRSTALLQIGWRSIKTAAQITDTPGSQAGIVFQRTETKRDIEVLADEIDESRRHINFQDDCRVTV